MIATHLGVIDEEQIDNMSYLMFNSVLTELGHKLNFEAVVNYAGNSFCKDSWDMINDTNPMTMDDVKHVNKNKMSIMSMLEGARTATPADLAKMKGYQKNGK